MHYTRASFALRYQLLSKLGAGVSASVYLVRDIVLDREIALKAVRMDREPDTVGREAETLALLNHPHIVTIYGSFVVEDFYVVAMEYLEGGTLAARLNRQKKKLAVEDFARYARQLLTAFAALHDMNIVHRDCKPSNIGFTKSDVLKLLDFGIAKRLHRHGATIAGTIKATAEYAPPEQLLGEAVDARSDLFSLAVVLYEMLTGVHPFLSGISERPCPSVMLARLLFTPPAPLRTLRPDIPACVEKTIMQNLQREPGRRSSNAHTFLDALEGRKVTYSIPGATTTKSIWHRLRTKAVTRASPRAFV